MIRAGSSQHNALARMYAPHAQTERLKATLNAKYANGTRPGRGVEAGGSLSAAARPPTIPSALFLIFRSD